MFEDDTGSQQQQLIVQVAHNPGPFLIKSRRIFNCWVIAVVQR